MRRAQIHNAVAKLRKARSAMEKKNPELLRSGARIAAISCAKSTAPFSISEGVATTEGSYTGAAAKIAGEKAVKNDIYQVYGTPAQVYALLPVGEYDAALSSQIDSILQVKKKRTRAINYAKLFYRLLSEGKLVDARKLLSQLVAVRGQKSFRTAGIGPFDGGALHKAERHARTGRVYSKSVKLIVTNPKALFAYIKKMQARVGFAKGAWAGIARELGSIRGLRAGGDITASWILRFSRGEAPFFILEDYSRAGKSRITLTSRVRYADQALSERSRRDAEKIARGRLQLMLQYAAKAEFKKALKS